MPSSSSITLTGHIGHVGSLKDVGNFKKLSFTVALNTSVKKNGQYEKITDWMTCNIIGSKAEYAAKYAVKGALVQVIGQLEGNHWVGKDNVERKSLEIKAHDVVFFPKGDSAKTQAAPAQKKYYKPTPATPDPFDDDIAW